MEKLEAHKNEAQTKLAKFQEMGSAKDDPANLKDFKLFLCSRKEMLSDDSPQIRAKIIQKLVKEIIVTQEGFEIYFNVGATYIKICLNNAEIADFGRKKEPEHLVTTLLKKNLRFLVRLLV
jgi:hypothetical protein